MSLEVIYNRVVVALAVVAGAILAAMALMISVEVGLRACCSSAIFGLTDLTEHALAAATFLAAPWVLARNAHVSVDIVTITLPPAIRHRLARVVDLVGAAVCVALSWYTLKALLIAVERGSMVRGILVVPEWITFASPALSGALLAIGFLLRAAHGQRDRPSAPGL
ncbi:MAG: TRAP transporter small permease [Rhizobiaceae bacterium]|nr:TRAP transporter small permease [Rhizobiaceae bacterium]MCV0407129.1 TRAP transporter small permease [Rhizobiaceae bacterium]